MPELAGTSPAAPAAGLPGPAGSRAGYPDDEVYLTSAEFVALPSHAQHAIWAAARGGLVDAVPVSPGSLSGPHRYNREQARRVLRELEGGR